ncbi:MAG: TIGR00159 family protein [Firmicutes bacterium]|nr:TIGR00159 family protein [Bacillota bacterium]
MWKQVLAAVSHLRLGWRDILDILIVTYIFYRAILIIKGTRAEQLVKGLVILLIAWGGSGLMGLKTFNWLLQGAMTAGLIAIPIIFQPELRKALEQLGRGRLFQNPLYEFEDNGSRGVLDELFKAIPVLVKKRIGALIVLERETGLKDIMETGIMIEGIVTAELLINIFMPRSPLHDGAVIIRDNVLAAAGCFLPFTENPNLSKELGARHRAAIGITEVSDAVTIIISEETGVISLAHNGKLTRYLDEKTLRSTLLNYYSKTKKKKNFPNLFPWRLGEPHEDEV